MTFANVSNRLEYIFLLTTPTYGYYTPLLSGLDSDFFYESDYLGSSLTFERTCGYYSG